MILIIIIPERPQIHFNVLKPHPHPPPDHQTGDIEAQCHCDEGGQGPGPGGGGHQLGQVEPGGHWLWVPGDSQMFKQHFNSQHTAAPCKPVVWFVHHTW